MRAQKRTGGVAASAAAIAMPGPGSWGSNVSSPVSPGSVDSVASSSSAVEGSMALGGWQRWERARPAAGTADGRLGSAYRCAGALVRLM